MRTDKQPYELLARWDREGRLTGIHVQYRLVTVQEDGTILGEYVGAAEPLERAAGFPLSELLSRLAA